MRVLIRVFNDFGTVKYSIVMMVKMVMSVRMVKVLMIMLNNGSSPDEPLGSPDHPMVKKARGTGHGGMHGPNFNLLSLYFNFV